MQRQLRIFHLIKSLGRGGAEMLLPETLRYADRDRFDYAYGYFLPWKDAMVPSLRAQRAEVTCFASPHSAAMVLAARRIAQHLRQTRIDLLHCHLPMAGVIGRLAAKLAGVPVVYTEHNVLERYHAVTRRLNLATWNWQQQVLAVSHEVASSIDRSVPDRTVPVTVVSNGIDVDRFQRDDAAGSSMRAQLGIPATAPVVGTVAVFRRQKALDDWIDAAAQLRSVHPDVHFLLVGDGPLRSQLEARAKARGLDGAVHWPGLQTDVRPYLAAIDVYLMSSVMEGLPLALLEAMAMQCAVVSTTVGGIPEVIRDGESGVLVPPRRPERLAAATARLLASGTQRESMGTAARTSVRARFSVARMTSDLERTYLDVLRLH